MKWCKYLLIIFLLFVPFGVVDAAVTASISVSTSSTIVGNSGKATLSIDAGGQHIGQIYGTFSCGGLGDKDLKFVVSDNPPTSKSYTIEWTAKSADTYHCSISGVQVGLLENPQEFINVSASPKTITVTSNTNSGGSSNNNNEKKSSGSSSNSNNNTSNKNSGTTNDKKEYDSDNSLKNLEIENNRISPDFNKDTLEYKLEVDENVEKINVKAVANSDKAEVSGIGEKNLMQGDNTIEVKVTAENGNEKIYKVIVTVKDLHPITITMNDKKYTIVKKNNNILEKLENYEEDSITIDDQKVISYVNKVTGVRVVILKDENNKASYYVYNEQTKKYSKYRFIKVGNITLQLLDVVGSLKHFKKYQIDIAGETVDIYKIGVSHKVGLIYGTNIKSGHTGYYVYDASEESLSKYYAEEVKVVEKEMADFKNKMMLFIGIVSGVAMISILISICQSMKRKKYRNRK